LFEISGGNIGAAMDAPLLALESAIPRWYAVYTRSNFEKKVAGSLGYKGLDYFLPTVQEQHRWKDRKKTVDMPVFPGYVFVRIPDKAEHRIRVLHIDGAVRILGTGGSIEPIPDSEIESVRLLLASGRPFFGHLFLREGARVRVRSGPLKDVEGVMIRFKNQNQLVVSVHLLARSIAVAIDIADVEAV
jgi:transcription termination/antitermination protein NusG